MNGLIDTNAATQAYSNFQATRNVSPELRQAHSRTEAREIAEDFEAVFLSQMLQPMFENLSAEEPFGGGSAEDMWRSMQVEEYGKAITKAGGIGVADAVYREIIKLQEVR